MNTFVLLKKNHAKYSHDRLIHLAEDKIAKLPTGNKKIGNYKKIIAILKEAA